MLTLCWQTQQQPKTKKKSPFSPTLPYKTEVDLTAQKCAKIYSDIFYEAITQIKRNRERARENHVIWVQAALCMCVRLLWRSFVWSASIPRTATATTTAPLLCPTRSSPSVSHLMMSGHEAAARYARAQLKEREMAFSCRLLKPTDIFILFHDDGLARIYCCS